MLTDKTKWPDGYSKTGAQTDTSRIAHAMRLFFPLAIIVGIGAVLAVVFLLAMAFRSGM